VFRRGAQFWRYEPSSGAISPIAQVGFPNGPTAFSVDQSGNIYFSDQGRHLVLRVTPNCQVEPVAGGGTVPLDNDSAGNVYLADNGNFRIRKITFVPLGPPSEPTATTTATVTPAPASCVPRPSVRVSAVPSGPGRIRVTITVQSSGGTPNNTLQAVRFEAAVNALIDIPGGPTASAGNSTYMPPPGTREVRFFVRRTSPGAAMQVPLIVVDSCGDWRTFVGAGTGMP
jgi:hypothetical protein